MSGRKPGLVDDLVRQLEAYREERDVLRRRVKNLDETPENWRAHCRVARLWDLEMRLIPKLEVRLKTAQASSAMVSGFGYHFHGTPPYFSA